MKNIAKYIPILIPLSGVLLAFIIYPYHPQAMWFGFVFATFSAVTNDSIQTLGTFINSNKKIDWRILWLFVGGIFVVTMMTGWLLNDNTLHFGRLNDIKYVPKFNVFQILAPIILLLLTYYKIPVSTTFLILSMFSSVVSIEKMLVKTFMGYIIAFLFATVAWGIILKFYDKFLTKPLTQKSEKTWRVFQWISTSLLWSSWLSQDMANVVVFLPRQLSTIQVTAVIIIVLLMLAFLLYNKGGGIQQIIREKTDVIEVRAATIIDLCYTIVLVVFKYVSHVPMSTTWVFLGLLAGREFIIVYFYNIKKQTGETVDDRIQRKTAQRTLIMILKDIFVASLGIVVSLLLVILAHLFG